MKFNSVNLNVGFNNISTFIDTGKLVIEESGLYMISVSVISDTNGAEFSMYKNGQLQSLTLISHGHWNTGTHVLALQLHHGDNIWVYTNSIHVSSGSCNSFSIIKVK